MRKMLSFRPERFVVPVLILVGWEMFSRSGALPPALLPAPSTVVVAWADWVFGIMLGVAIGWSRFVEVTIEPTLQMLRPIPPVSWIPLAIIWFGIADKPAIFLVFLGAFFPVLLNTIHGVKTVDRNLIRAGAMAGADQRRLLRHIVLPAAMPSIFAGLRIAIGSAWMLTVTAEMVAVKSGVGYVLWDSYYFLRYDIVIAAMASIGLLGYLSDLAIRLVMARVLHWQRGTTLQGEG